MVLILRTLITFINKNVQNYGVETSRHDVKEATHRHLVNRLIHVSEKDSNPKIVENRLYEIC